MPPAPGGAPTLQLFHTPLPDIPLALATWHRSHPVGACATVVLATGEDDARRLLEGAGTDILDLRANRAGRTTSATRRTLTTGAGVRAAVVRARTLPDLVGPGMRLLVCGLNPSLYAADAGVGFARPGNRFWPAALAAGVVTRDRDPWHALQAHGVGFTDLVKRATPGAAEVRPEEFAAGVERVRWLVGALRPGVLCVVGLAGWRVAVDRHASAGQQPASIDGVPVYLMPNTSGRNATTDAAGFAGHLRAAAALARGCRG